MADLRIGGGAGLPAVQPTQRNETVRAAQRAFFQAALNGVAPSEPTRPVAAQPTARTTSAPAAQPAADAEPTRYARPGSLLDIRV